ncbi:MAG: hypothetical protein DCF19_13490 [Pseudanabaena frigida]|uniref:Phytanoyl-CoA dioxygenase n=1 Tax=Pseudanabaena frigida TaxID=945775 RepID=A0A2W4W349_9CYAN|nr:MAG: hypothetical protein DCF19_13490 [Pseudanabaena frigida]
MYQFVISQAFQTFDKLWQRVVSAPSDIALFISNLEIIEQKILYPRYQKFIQEYQPLLNSLRPEENKIVQELEQYGVSITNLEELAIPLSDRFFSAAQKISEELKHNAELPLYKGKHTLTANAEQIMRYPELFLWGADAKLLRIVEGYLKLPAGYDGLSYYYSPPDSLESGPRKWHRDKEDWQMIKIGVYINDVDEDGGPFECVTPAANEVLVKSLHSDYLRKYKTAFHQEIESMLPEHMLNNWYKSCVGKVGTVIFVDTARYFHRGKPPTKFGRSAIFFGYCSRRPRHPFFCGRSPLSKAELRYMASLLPEDVRDSVTWRDRLQGLSKWIPKNRLKV